MSEECGNCPWCGEDSGVQISWANLGRDDLNCRACGKPVELDHEEDWDDARLWLTKRKE